jgi:hypothetical protein
LVAVLLLRHLLVQHLILLFKYLQILPYGQFLQAQLLLSIWYLVVAVVVEKQMVVLVVVRVAIKQEQELV